MSSKTETYAGGLTELNARYQARRAPFDFGHESLPPLDSDLQAMTTQIVPESLTGPLPGEPNRATSWMRKRRDIAKEFVGNSELAYLNALLIANLRKRQAPPHTADLFLRLWAEQHAHLIDVLDLRWQVSSVMTFADHGNTSVQRQVGQALRMLFGMMKLYEFERLFSGLDPDVEFKFKGRSRADLPMQMEKFSLVNGGLDVNTLAPVWELALTDPVIAPLANHLFEQLNSDPATLFRRLSKMRETRKKQIEAKA